MLAHSSYSFQLSLAWPPLILDLSLRTSRDQGTSVQQWKKTSPKGPQNPLLVPSLESKTMNQSPSMALRLHPQTMVGPRDKTAPLNPLAFPPCCQMCYLLSTTAVMQGRRQKGKMCSPKHKGCWEGPAAVIAGCRGKLMGETKGKDQQQQKQQQNFLSAS